MTRTDVEMWRPIAGTDGKYEVSDMGRVRSWARSTTEPILLRCSPSNGYPVASLSVGGRCIRRTVHRLVMEAFRGMPPEGFVCAHLNGDRSDPRLVNLRWVTPGENTAHMWLHGTMMSGERSKTAKLTESQVEEIRRLAAEGATWLSLAKQFKVSKRAILRIATGESWSGGPRRSPAVAFTYVPPTSKYRGVKHNPRTGKWEANINRNGKRTYLGQFSAEEDAARAYDDAARRVHGDDGLYNFPRPGEKSAPVGYKPHRQRIVA